MSDIKIAVIDDGVYPEFMAGIAVCERYIVTEDNIVTKDTTKPFLSHGTLCAKIIQEYCDKELDFISIKAMNDEGKGLIGQLTTALEWCGENGVKLISMSLSTCIYEDSKVLAPVVKKLTDKNIILVSAFSNTNTVSWPASLPKVIGVRADRNQETKIDQISIDKNYVGNIENSFVVRINRFITDKEGRSHQARGANSTATPVISGTISKAITANTSFDEVMQILLKESKEHTFTNLFNCFKAIDNEPDIPIIWADPKVAEEVAQLFKKDEYKLSVFTDFGKGVPLDLYVNEEDLPKGLYTVLNNIYVPNLMIFSRKKEDKRLYCDAYISDTFSVNVEGKEKQFTSADDVYRYLIGIFE